MSDLGGVKFFNLAVETPEGDMELLEFVLEGEQLEGLTVKVRSSVARLLPATRHAAHVLCLHPNPRLAAYCVLLP